MNRTLLALTLALLAPLTFGGGCTQNINDTNVEDESVTLTQLQEYIKSDKKTTLLIDSRMASLYNAGHIPGAVNMSVTQINPGGAGGEKATDPRLAKYDALIVYGANPGSINSMALAKRLLEAGYKDVRYYPDGFDGWKAAGMPVEATPSAAPAAK